MTPRFWAVLCLSLCCWSVASAAEAPQAGDLATVSDVVVDSGRDGGAVWFALSGSERFEAPKGTLKDAGGVLAALKASTDKEETVTVKFDPSSGFIDPASGAATFSFQRIEVHGEILDGMAPDAEPRRTPTSPEEAALARAIGLLETADPPVLIAALQPIGADPSLPVAWRILALRNEADLQEGAALRDDPPGQVRDQALMAALATDRAWSALAPQDPEAADGVAEVLLDLGAYDEAQAAMDAIRKRWPDRDYTETIHIAAIDRIEGRPDRALAVLDDLVGRAGPQDGMKYHYHRGRILMALGRHDDAVKEFDNGIASQPDYPYAFADRACAQAQLGRFGPALADQKRAVEILNHWMKTGRPNAATAFDLKRGVEIADILSAAAAGGAPPPRDLCDHDWDGGDTERARSSLLPPLSKNAAK